MWVPKLLLSPVEIRIFCPKTTNFGQKFAFLVILVIWYPIGGLVDGCGGQALSRKTSFYLFQYQYQFLFSWSWKFSLLKIIWKAGKNTLILGVQGLFIQSPMNAAAGRKENPHLLFLSAMLVRFFTWSSSLFLYITRNSLSFLFVNVDLCYIQYSTGASILPSF